MEKKLTSVIKSKFPPEGGRVDINVTEEKEFVVIKTKENSLGSVDIGNKTLKIPANFSGVSGPVFVEVNFLFSSKQKYIP